MRTTRGCSSCIVFLGYRIIRYFLKHPYNIVPSVTYSPVVTCQVLHLLYMPPTRVVIISYLLYICHCWIHVREHVREKTLYIVSRFMYFTLDVFDISIYMVPGTCCKRAQTACYISNRPPYPVSKACLGVGEIWMCSGGWTNNHRRTIRLQIPSRGSQ